MKFRELSSLILCARKWRVAKKQKDARGASSSRRKYRCGARSLSRRLFVTPFLQYQTPVELAQFARRV
jgi:hypothetical protein